LLKISILELSSLIRKSETWKYEIIYLIYNEKSLLYYSNVI
jgi:hypothetical protein